MPDSRSLDVRKALAAMCATLGLLLWGFGFATRNAAELYIPSGQVNVNLRWGGVLLGFGAVMWLFSLVGDYIGRGRRRVAPPSIRRLSLRATGDGASPLEGNRPRAARIARASWRGVSRLWRIPRFRCCLSLPLPLTPPPVTGSLATLDWLVIVVYFALTFGVASRRRHP